MFHFILHKHLQHIRGDVVIPPHPPHPVTPTVPVTSAVSAVPLASAPTNISIAHNARAAMYLLPPSTRLHIRRTHIRRTRHTQGIDTLSSPPPTANGSSAVVMDCRCKS